MNTKPPLSLAAFTLLELIVVIVILAVVSSYVFTRFSQSSGYRQDTIVEQIISAGHLAQQLSMNDSSRTFSLSIQPSQINLLVDGVSFSTAGTSFPLIFDNSVNLSPTVNIVYDSLGETTATTVTLQLDTNQDICFESSGFIHRC